MNARAPRRPLQIPVTQRVARPTPVRLRALTEHGWVMGVLHVPARSTILSLLNHGGPFLTMTDVALPGHTTDQPFFALRRDSIILAYPHGRRVQPDPARGRGHRHSVFMVYPGGLIYGVLDLAPRLRVSDFLAGKRGFFVVEEALLSPRKKAGASEDRERSHPSILVSSRHILGVSERGK